MRTGSIWLIGLFLMSMGASASLSARTWTDATGRFKVDADLIAINDDVVVLKSKSGRLIAVEIAQLSPGDQDFLRTEEAGTSKLGAKDKDHVWRLQGDAKLTGSIVGYFAQDLIVERRNAKLFVEGNEEKDVPELLMRMLSRIVEHFEMAKIEDLPSLKNWLSQQGKMPHVYPIEGVRIALTSGEEVKVPIFLLASAERALLEPGLTRWKALQNEKLEEMERSWYAQREAVMLSSAVRAYQQDAASQAQARMLQLDLLAVDAGVTDLWEVLLIPPNPYAYPFTVVVPARNSAAAQLVAQ
jgi:hypothetical protein